MSLKVYWTRLVKKEYKTIFFEQLSNLIKRSLMKQIYKSSCFNKETKKKFKTNLIKLKYFIIKDNPSKTQSVGLLKPLSNAQVKTRGLDGLWVSKNQLPCFFRSWRLKSSKAKRLYILKILLYRVRAVFVDQIKTSLKEVY